jgi:hypothetical protein
MSERPDGIRKQEGHKSTKAIKERKKVDEGRMYGGITGQLAADRGLF